MIAIIDYGVGNLFSLKSSFAAIGAEARVTSHPEDLAAADRIILPGVGAFGDAAEKLRRAGMDQAVLEQVSAGKPLLGICLGMQLLLEESLEYGTHAGLGLIPGQVRPISEVIPADYKIPHIGWNALQFCGEPSRLFSRISEGDAVYFVHSFQATGCAAHTIACAEYGAPLTAAVAKENVFGCQFHPEKSGDVGMKILQAYCRENW
jgi:glutamine amidotransferase